MDVKKNIKLLVAVATMHAFQIFAADLDHRNDTQFAPLTSPTPTTPSLPASLPSTEHFALPPEEFIKIPGPQIDVDPIAKPKEVIFGPSIESLQGVSSISVRARDGSLYSQKLFGQLQEKDSFLSGPQGYIRIAYAEGTQVILTPHTHVVVFHEKDALGGPPIAALEVKSGEVRILVSPSKRNDDADDDPDELEQQIVTPKNAFRFLVKLPKGFLAVRGTDFLVSTTAKGSEVRTLSGVVDLARTLQALYRGTRISLEAGQLGILRESRIEKPEDFLIKKYLSELTEKYPPMAGLKKIASEDLKSGRLEEKFRIQRESEEKTRKTILKEMRKNHAPGVPKDLYHQLTDEPPPPPKRPHRRRNRNV